MKTNKGPSHNAVKLVIYGFIVSLLCTTPFLLLTTIVYAETPPVTAAAATAPTILGGQPADAGEWPWQAVVMAGSNFCGGTLIHTEWVLTVAHCLYSTEKEVYPAEAIQVTLGDYNLYTSDESEQQFTVDRVLLHPNLNLAIFDNDIALLHLTTPAAITPFVAPIGLSTNPEAEAFVVPGALATVTGWGSIKENGGLAPVLREVVVPLVANEDCHQVYGMVTANMLCAGYPEGGKDACQGDSGGPLVVPDPTGTWQLAGLVSFGQGCGRPLFYGVYTRVANYVDWIEAATGPLDPPLGGMTELTPTPTTTPTATVTVEPIDQNRATPEATASPTPVPPTPSPTTESVFGTAQNFLPVVYR